MELHISTMNILKQEGYSEIFFHIYGWWSTKETIRFFFYHYFYFGDKKLYYYRNINKLAIGLQHQKSFKIHVFYNGIWKSMLMLFLWRPWFSHLIIQEAFPSILCKRLYLLRDLQWLGEKKNPNDRTTRITDDHLWLW